MQPELLPQGPRKGAGYPRAILSQHPICTPLAPPPSYPLAGQQASCQPQRLRQPRTLFTVNSSGAAQGCNKDDPSRCNHFYVGTKHFVLLETALSPLGQEQHEETPEPRWPQASTWLMPGWGLKAIQPHARRPRPQQCLADATTVPPGRAPTHAKPAKTSLHTWPPHTYN